MFPTSACCVLSYVQLFVTLWTVALQAPLPMEFSRQEYSSGLPFPTPRKLPHPGIQPGSPAIAGGFFTTEPPGKPIYHCQDYSLNNWLGISLVVHWLKLCASTAGSVGLITGPGTKIPKATWSGKTTVLIMSPFKKGFSDTLLSPPLVPILEKRKATQSSILAWRISWTVCSMGSQSQTWLNDFHFTCAYKNSTHSTRGGSGCHACFNTGIHHSSWKYLLPLLLSYSSEIALSRYHWSHST